MSNIENKNYIIRPETPADYDTVIRITREAFWNIYQPGCDEHYIVQRFRTRPEYISGLSLVLEAAGQVRAHILYTRAQITTDDGRVVPVLTFGPISVLPQHQKQGYGGALIRYSLQKAKEEYGCGAVFITGSPQYYRRFGFVPGRSLGVYYEDLRTEPTDYFMGIELVPGFLQGMSGVYRDGPGYNVEGIDIDAYDAAFPPKEKKRLPGQIFG